MSNAITADICKKLVDLQKVRVFCIQRQSMADRSTESFIAMALGYRADLDENGKHVLDEKTRKRFYAEARKAREAIEKGDDDIQVDGQTVITRDVLRPIVLGSAIYQSFRVWV